MQKNERFEKNSYFLIKIPKPAEIFENFNKILQEKMFKTENSGNIPYFHKDFSKPMKKI